MSQLSNQKQKKIQSKAKQEQFRGKELSTVLIAQSERESLVGVGKRIQKGLADHKEDEIIDTSDSEVNEKIKLRK